MLEDVGEVFPDGKYQRCVVHFYRNVLSTSNVIKRMNREIRRRTWVVGAFPDGNAALILVYARLRHVAETQWGSKKYMNMTNLEATEQEALVG